MYSEIGFLFELNQNLTPALSNNDNTGNIYGRPIRVATAAPNPNTSQGLPTSTNQGQTSQSPFGGAIQQVNHINSLVGNATSLPANKPAVDEGILIFKSKRREDSGTLGIRNYLKDNVYRYDSSDEDPYISLIRYFSGNKTKALMLRAADFAYLKDLGVYPINRLWILRRFPDNCVVPNNLLEWGRSVQPISTVIGWMKDREDNPMMTLSFNEVWTDQNEMIDKVMAQMLKDEFGFKLPAMMSVPGWSQGILFGMLNAMQLTGDFDAMNVPTGNPNVLRTGKMREINGQGLKSNMNYTLETCYEQKYINGIDPGLAMMDIISNLLRMGTSDQKFILSNSPALQQLIGNLNQSTPTIDAWIKLIMKLVDSFVTGVVNFIDRMKSDYNSTVTLEDKPTSGTDDDNRTRVQFGTQIEDSSIFKNMGGSVLAVINNLGSTILAGTVMKYKWPLKGSIGLMSGISTTPWHLTIGNPYSPIINIGNVYVDNVEIKLSNDLGFNDMPARIDVNISTQFGRPLGKQELEKMFNNGYKRVYSKVVPNSLSESQESSSATAANGRYTAENVLNNLGQKQPDNVEIKTQKSSGGDYYPVSVQKYP